MFFLKHKLLLLIYLYFREVRLDDFNSEIVNYPFLDGDVPPSPSYGVYFSQLIRFARVFLMLMTTTTKTYF